jgi:hypothetical protein
LRGGIFHPEKEKKYAAVLKKRNTNNSGLIDY